MECDYEIDFKELAETRYTLKKPLGKFIGVKHLNDASMTIFPIRVAIFAPYPRYPFIWSPAYFLIGSSLCTPIWFCPPMSEVSYLSNPFST